MTDGLEMHRLLRPGFIDGIPSQGAVFHFVQTLDEDFFKETVVTEADKAELKRMFKELAEETGMTVPDTMIEDSVRLEQEARYFVDYLDARFGALKMAEVYRMPLQMLSAQTLLGQIFAHLEPDLFDEMVKDLVEGAKFEREALLQQQKGHHPDCPCYHQGA